VIVGSVGVLSPSEPVNASREDGSLEVASLAAANHMRLGFEIDPGLTLDIPGALLPIRAAHGEATTADLDPSHLLCRMPIEPPRSGPCRA
jgi:hypothetical protein